MMGVDEAGQHDMLACVEHATSAVAGAAPAGTSSTIRPPFTTTPRSAPSARIARGSLIQIGFASLMNLLLLTSAPDRPARQGPARLRFCCDLLLRLGARLARLSPGSIHSLEALASP